MVPVGDIGVRITFTVPLCLLLAAICPNRTSRYLARLTLGAASVRVLVAFTATH